MNNTERSKRCAPERNKQSRRRHRQHTWDAVVLAGVEAQLAIYPRMWHVWQLNLALPQAAQALNEIAHFLRSRLQRLH